jgi:hypothetical protein
MYKVLIKKGHAIETTEDDNYSEFYLNLYLNIRDNLKVCLFIDPKKIYSKNSPFNLVYGEKLGE